MANPLDLTGQHVLVTGASSGIGRETAVLLSRLGATVGLNGRSAEQLGLTFSQLEGNGHYRAAFELNDLDQIPVWIKSLTKEHGPLHGLAHCAGMHASLPLRFLGTVALDQMMRVNFQSAVMLARGFRQKGCHSPDGGSIVFVSSVAGIAGVPGVAAYSASKAALLGLTRSLALELAPERIRVNAVAPGQVQSEMTERMKGQLTDEQFAAIVRSHPLGIGTASDVAGAIAFLLAGTGRWITGSTLVVDGGYTAQ